MSLHELTLELITGVVTVVLILQAHEKKLVPIATIV